MSRISNNARITCLKDWLRANVPNAFKDRSAKKHIEQSEGFEQKHKLKHI